MPTYRVVSEIDHHAEHREPRGAWLRLDEARLVSLVDAHDVIDVIRIAFRRLFAEHGIRAVRITSVEETHPGFFFTDDEISRTLCEAGRSPTGEPLIDAEQFEGDTESLYDSAAFVYVVQQVVHGLRESGLVPGLDISVLDNEIDAPYAMIEVHDDARSIYLSRGCEIKHLTGDRGAVGWDGVIAVAREIIAISNDLH
jgi:hypothetical protein